MATVAENLVSYWDIGKGDNPATRYTQYVDSRGWKRFVDVHLAGEINAGIRRFYLWMPFGCETTEGPDASDHIYPDAFTPGQTYHSTRLFDQWLRGSVLFGNYGFVSAMRELTSNGIQVICHMGDLRGQQFKHRWNAERWIENCLEPFREANVDLCFNGDTDETDGGVGQAKDDTADWQLAMRLRNKGVKVYCGGLPFGSETNPTRYKWHQGDCLMTAEHFNIFSQVSMEDENDPGTVALDDIEGEVIMLYGAAGLSEEDWVAEYASIVPTFLGLATNYSACIFVSKFLNDGGVLADLLP